MTKKIALKSLTALALALPGITESKAEGQVLKPKTDLMYAKYSDGKKRYKIDVFQLMLQAPLGKKWDFSITAGRDVMSGASVAFYVPASFHSAALPQTTLAEQWSGPSIADSRSFVVPSVRYFAENDSNVKVGAYISEENDYEARTGNIQYQKELNKKNTELTLGYSYSSDRIKPTVQANAIFTPRVNTRHKFSQMFVAGIKQDISKFNLILQSFEYSAERGFLSDPYRLITIYEGFGFAGGSLIPVIQGNYAHPGHRFSAALENRPSHKRQFVSSTKFIQYIKPLDSAIHFAYRYVRDSWHLRSHTYTITYYQPFCDLYEASAELRLYRQSQSKIYSMAFAAVPGSPFPAKMLGKHYSSDYRLGRFGDRLLEFGLSRKFAKGSDAKVGITGGWMKRREGWGIGHAHPHNPSNNFKTYYISVNLSAEF